MTITTVDGTAIGKNQSWLLSIMHDNGENRMAPTHDCVYLGI